MKVLEKYEKYLKDNYEVDGEQNTIKAYISDVKQFLDFFENHFGETIEDFSRAHVIEYKKFLNDKQYKFSTMNRKIASISIYENFLIESGIRKEDRKVVKQNDFYKIERPFITADMLPRKTIKKVRLKAGEGSKRDYAMFVLLDEGGLRVSELTNIQLNRDVKLDMFTLCILGKGKKIRSIVINNIMLDAINDYLPEREKLLNGRENKYLFVSNKTANTNKPMSRTSINNISKKYCNEVNENKINPHIFRHNCGTTKYEEGYSDIMLKKLLGHSSNATEIYTHPGGERFREIINLKNN